MSAPTQSRVPAGVTDGGQFSVGARAESGVMLDDAPRQLPEGAPIAIRNPLPEGPKWLHGVATYDAPLTSGAVGAKVDDGEGGWATYVIPAVTVVPHVEPADYDGDDVDAYAEVFEWTPDDWGYYYDARAERDQTGSYKTGFAEGAASAGRPSEVEHPAGVGRVQVWNGEDGVPVFQIDTDGGSGGRLRINLNDAPVYNGDPERDDSAVHALGQAAASLREAAQSPGTDSERLQRVLAQIEQLEARVADVE